MRSIMITSAPSTASSSLCTTRTPILPISAGISVGGAATVTFAFIFVSRWMFERTTRECAMSPMIETLTPASRPRRSRMAKAAVHQAMHPRQASEALADGEGVEKSLRRMFVRAVAGIDDRNIRQPVGQHLRRAGMLGADDDHVRMHCHQVLRRIDERLAL